MLWDSMAHTYVPRAHTMSCRQPWNLTSLSTRGLVFGRWEQRLFFVARDRLHVIATMVNLLMTCARCAGVCSNLHRLTCVASTEQRGLRIAYTEILKTVNQKVHMQLIPTFASPPDRASPPSNILLHPQYHTFPTLNIHLRTASSSSPSPSKIRNPPIITIIPTRPPPQRLNLGPTHLPRLRINLSLKLRRRPPPQIGMDLLPLWYPSCLFRIASR